jgi:hypothetical protein
MVNRQQETNLHNIYPAFEQWPRTIVELGVVIGGTLVPLAAAFFPPMRSNRLSLFLPASALLPTALIAMGSKLELAHRPSEGRTLPVFFHSRVSDYFRAAH